MRALLMAGVILCGFAAGTNASPVSGTYSVQTTFTSGPYGNISGSFDTAYDTAVSGQLDVGNVSINLPSDYMPINFFYRASDRSIIFGNYCGVSGCGFPSGKDVVASGFHVDDTGATVASVFDGTTYQVAAGSKQYSSSTQSEQFNSNLAVPEPASLALLIPGLASLAAVRRRGWSMRGPKGGRPEAP